MKSLPMVYMHLQASGLEVQSQEETQIPCQGAVVCSL